MIYHEVVDNLRAFVTSVSPVPVNRIAWDHFGDVGGDFQKPDPAPQNPPDGVWLRAELSGEAPVPAGGGVGWYGWVEKTGVLSIDLFSETPVDQAVAGIDVHASTIETALGYAEIGSGTGKVEFGPAATIPLVVKKPEGRNGLRVTAVYTRLEERGETTSEVALPVNYTLTGHSLLPLNLVRPVGGGNWSKAQADAEDNAAEAIVSAVAGDRVALRFGGSLRISHGLGDGTNPSARALYLSQDTAGAITTTEPLSGVRQRVGSIINAGELLIDLEPAETL